MPNRHRLARSRHAWRPLLAVALLLTASGCSVKLAYNNLDRLVRWSAGDYVSLDTAQRAYLDAAVAEVWTWHRREHLPRYADYLDALGPRLLDGDPAVGLAELIDTVLDWAGEIEARVVPVTAHVLASLSDDQVAVLAANLAERNAEFAEPERGLSLAEAQAAWQAEITDRLSSFTGRLNSLQTAYLAEQSSRYVPERALWAERRALWQADLLALLRHRADPAAFARGFEQLAGNREVYYGPELARIFAGNRALNQEVNAWLLGSLTDRQRTRFVDRLESLAGDLRDLANDRRRGRVSDAELPCLVGC